MPTSSSSPPSPPPTSASAVLAALLSSVAAYILGAIVLPSLSAFFKRDRALKKLDLPTPKARNFAERVFGTMARFDPTSPANYCRTVMQAWARECGDPPLMVSRGMQRHLVIVLDPAAANAVLSRASGQEKSTEAYFGLNLISDPRGRNTILSHATASREWKWVRKAVAPAFSQAAMKAGFEGAIRPSAEAAAEALARACEEKSKSSSSSSEKGGAAAAAAASVSVNVDDLAAATAMDVITAFGFGVRSNAVERLGAELAERERTRKEESSGGIGGDAKSSSSPSSGSSPIPVPEPLIPGAEHTVEAMHAATEAAELYVVEPWRAWRLFRLSEPVRRGAVAMARVRACIDAVLAAAADKEDEERRGGGGNDGEGGVCGGGVSGGKKTEETIFSRLRAVAPEVAALDPTDDPAACLRREAGLLYFAGIDTSSHTLAYTLALLAAHPRAAAKVEAELASAGLLASSSSSAAAASSDSDSSSALAPPRRLEFADLSRSALPYLNAVLLESMRLMPVAAGGTARTAGRGGFELTVPEWEEEKKGGESGGRAGQQLGETTTRTVRVPEGVDMWVPFYVLHRSKKVWGEDADEFVPERFLDPAAPFVGGGGSEKEGGAKKKGGDGGDDDGAAAAGEAARRFLPFSLGARDCVGQALARTALVAELATLLGRFSFGVDRERMGGSLLPSPPEVEEGGSGGEKVKDAADGIEGLGSTVIANEAMAVTLRVLGGVWLLARPRAARGAAAVVGGERES